MSVWRFLQILFLRPRDRPAARPCGTAPVRARSLTLACRRSTRAFLSFMSHRPPTNDPDIQLFNQYTIFTSPSVRHRICETEPA